ncbi:NT-type C2 domain [Arabidopsis thaliana x Arabidopsis arenosa]|uniref:NT-type C2 domain n=1 Tax=Arabidopsis thaliana x Arabidopsis arenosa TaxID=1240361 RepID=A0A8T2C3W0_9BRAS|nr:NT-type C2 domain [Arabidopsis thaliana x Arabidopsis arenosa]
MSRLAKWKLEKAKVKVVFRLQFHATHVPQAGWDKLFISFIPADSVKATAKTTKALVRNGTCKWGDPIYETTRLLQDTRTKQFDEKLYKIVVAMGTSRSSILGEAMINLAEYADALKPFAVVLPLQGCDSGAILHVTIQLLTSKTGFREFEQQRELSERGPSTTSDHSSPDESSRCRISPSDETFSHVDKTNIRGSFKEKFRDNSLVEETVGPNDLDSGLGYDVSSNTSGSLNAEKHDISSTNELDSLKSVVSGDLSGLAQNPQKDKDGQEWHHSWGSDYLGKNSDLGNAIEDNNKLKGFLEDMESSINEIKIEVSSLQCHADDIGSKAQDFSQILISEIGSGDHLVREVSVLKSECSKLKEEMERLRNVKSHVLYNSKDQDNVPHSLQLRWLQGLLVVEDNIREIQNKVCYGYHDRDLRLFLSDFESLLGVLQDIKRQIGQPISHFSTVPSEKITMTDNKERGMSKAEHFVSASEVDTDIYQPELDPLQYLGMPDLTSREPNSADSVSAMRDKILELVRGLDESKAERDSLTKKMDQMECYYESLVQELEETQRQLLVELQNLRTEHSTCLYSISGAKAEMETLRHDMNEQTLRFSEEKKTLDSLNKELDKRAMAAEAGLKRARLNYSIAVNHLQKDLELLSSQVVSMFETNENLIKQAFPEPPQSFHECIQSTDDSNPEKQDTRDVKLTQFQNEKKGMKERPFKGDIILLEDLKRSLHVQESLYQKVEEELYEMHSRNLYLEVFSNILRETFLEASVDIRIMKAKIDELGWQLELSTEAKEILKQRLDITLDEVCSLNEEKTTCIAKWNAVALQNQSLEANLQNITHENLILLQKIDELESVVLESKNWKTNYETCICEKEELAELMEKEAVEKAHFRSRLATVQAEFDAVRGKFDDLVTANGNLQQNLSSLKEKLINTLGCYNEKLISLPLWEEGVDLDLESRDLTEQLDKFLCKICEKCFVLISENNELMKEKSKTESYLRAAESDVMELKQKHENDVQCLVTKLEASTALLQRLQLETESIMDKMKVITEAEQNYESRHLDFLSRLDYFENEMHLLVSKNEGLGQEISELSSVAVEHGRTKLLVEELAEEKNLVLVSLQDKSQETLGLVRELENLKKTFDHELRLERSSRQELEIKMQDLTSELIAKSSKLMSFDEQSSELVRLKKRVSDLELEKATHTHRLTRYETSLRSLTRDSSYISDLESQLLEMMEFSVAADIQIVFTRTEWETYADKLHKEHFEVLTAFNDSRNVGAQHMDANIKLLADLDSVKSELKIERSLRNSLERRVEELASELDEKHLLLENFDLQKSQVELLEKMVAELESEKSSQRLEYVRNAHRESSSIEELFQCLIATDVQLIFTKIQSEICINDLAEQLSYCSTSHLELQKKYTDVESALNHCLVNEMRYMDENNQLLISLEVLKSELESSMAKSRALANRNDEMSVELEEHATRDGNAERSYSERSLCAPEVEQLKSLLFGYEEEIENLTVLKAEAEITVEIVKDKLTGLCGKGADELETLKNRCSDLAQKLSEQILKTEEFKSLSNHLKELKDNAEAECNRAREKADYKAPLTPQQESLRIIFIKEQYETKLQELQYQLTMSKKHGEEILMKLQDAIDENEARKKAESSQLKRTKELEDKILELEADRQSVIYDKREKTTAYDMMKAELDCSLLSLECCKEEKQKLEAILQQCKEESLKMSKELESRRELVQRCSSHKNIEMEENDRLNIVVSDLADKNTIAVSSGDLVNNEQREVACLDPTVRIISPRSKIQGAIQSSNVNGNRDQLPSGEAMALDKSEESLALINDNFRAETLRSSMDHLNNELERMKNENLLQPQDDNDSDTRFPGLEQELIQLRQAKEELQSIFPLSHENFSCGNALERVLALEIELAEALRGKKKSTIHFQSSFLKQHTDDEAIFQSFRDINNLIEEMLETKGRYSSMETELREMHDRYSQLSLKFAEVEGERQKLMMTLKNVRASKKAMLLNRSSSATLGEH